MIRPRDYEHDVVIIYLVYDRGGIGREMALCGGMFV